MESNWYKNAIFYSLDIETFFDSNGDGTGDFHGLIKKLDYIAGLGVTCIWLLPFYPSPNRDNGYDVMDYYGVDERLGSLGDFVQFMDKAGEYGIRVIIDLVVNHTSIRHPWFQQARKDRHSVYRDFYVWTDEPLAFEKENLMFTGEEETVWSFDETAGQYYLHRFYKEQPDLNIANPMVREEIFKIMGYWLNLGVSGFRIDAAEILVETYGMKEARDQELHLFLNEMREFVTSKKADAILLAETNVSPEKMPIYIQDGKRVHMLFDFFLNQHLFLSLSTENAQPLVQAMESLPDLHGSEQWLNFLRHHDELSLKLLDEKDRHSVYERFAPDKTMRIYGKGIRRRLSPMLNGQRQLIELSYSLLFSLPGIPLIRYGDEIGMGDDLSLEGRSSVRTPMQWSADKNGGFSLAGKDKLVLPVIEKGEYGYSKVNVIDQQRCPTSLLNWMERLITIRKQCPEIGLGDLQVIPSTDNKVLIHGYHWQEEGLYFLHNISSEKISIKNSFGAQLLPVLESSESKMNSDKNIVLEPYAYKWFRLKN